jgi:hypothetical protein
VRDFGFSTTLLFAIDEEIAFAFGVLAAFFSFESIAVGGCVEVFSGPDGAESLEDRLGLAAALAVISFFFESCGAVVDVAVVVLFEFVSEDFSVAEVVSVVIVGVEVLNSRSLSDLSTACVIAFLISSLQCEKEIQQQTTWIKHARNNETHTVIAPVSAD